MKWPGRRLSTRARVAALLGLFLLAAFGPLVARFSAQPASRYALTAALAQHRTVDISASRHRLGIDRATYNGHLRSDKAPGQPLLAVPAYLTGRAFGAQPAAQLRLNGDLGLWWVTLWTAFLPFVALVVLMFLAASRRSWAAGFAAAVGLGVCTMMLPHATNLYGAALAGLAAYAGWLALEHGPPTTTRLICVGALIGSSVVVEYETAIVLAVVGIVVVQRVRSRAAWCALGAAGPLAILAWYQWAAFGRPWRTAHAYYATAAIRRQIVGYEFPGWHGIDATFFGNHGLLMTNAIVLVALLAAIMLVRSPDPVARRHAVVALAIMLPYLVLCVGWRGTPALEEPGPRYLIPALPFLAVPLAMAWARLRRAALVAMLLSGIVAVSAACTYILAAPQEQVLPVMLRRVWHHKFLPTIWSMAFGRFGIVLYVGSVALAAVALARAWHRNVPATS